MDLFITTFESIAVLLGIGFIGFWIIRKKIIPEQALGTLLPLALDIALPSLIFINIVTDFSPSEFPQWWLLPLWWLIFTGISGCLTFVLRFFSHKETRQEFAISLFYQNGIFIPLAILTGMFGASSSYIPILFLFSLFYPAFFFNTYFVFFKKKVKSMNWKKLINPVLIATILALSIRIVGFQDYVPDVVLSIASLLGTIALPLIMLIIGGNIYLDFHAKGSVYITEIVKFVLLKNIIYPLFFLGILILIRPEYPIALLLIIQSAVPPVTSVSLFTERAGGNRAIVNQFIVSSLLFSLISIPLILTLFSYYFTP
jgi:hypothetical protein